MDYSPPESSVHGILQARMLEWVAISFSRRSSQPRDQTQNLHRRQILYRLSPYGRVLCKLRGNLLVSLIKQANLFDKMHWSFIHQWKDEFIHSFIIKTQVCKGLSVDFGGRKTTVRILAPSLSRLVFWSWESCLKLWASGSSLVKIRTRTPTW